MSKRKAAPKYVWMSFDNDGWCDIWVVKPQLDTNTWYAPDGKNYDDCHLIAINPQHFERFFGMEVSPGTCLRFLWRSPLVAPKATKRKKVKA